MAQKRMFSLSVVDTDQFLDMPISSRLLYYELGMRADDDGFVDNFKKILLFTGLKEDDLKVLIAKQYVLPFDSGVIVIRHWRMNNYLRNDRYKSTQYQEELKKLSVDDNLVYQMDTTGIPGGIHSIDKNRLDKNSIDNNKAFKKPTLEEVKEYCLERKNGINPQHFIDFYESKGWMVGKNKMKDWKACIRTWEKRTTNTLPTWFDKTNEVEDITKEEKEELEAILNDLQQ